MDDQVDSIADSITIVVPGKPVPKGRPRFNMKTGRTYTPSATVNYERLVGLLANQAMAGKPVLSGPLHMELRAHFEIPRSWSKSKKDKALLGELSPSRMDIDNIIKAVADAMNAIVYRDDSQIVSLNARMVYANQAFVVATVKPVSTAYESTRNTESADVGSEHRP